LGVALATASCARTTPKPAVLDENCRPDAPAVSVPAAARESLPNGVHFSSTEENWARVAREIPGGFGGVIRQDGGLLVYLVDTTQRTEAAAALIARRVVSSSDAPRIRAARWSFDQLYDWNRYIILRYSLPNRDVIGWGIDEHKNRLAFDVVDESSRKRVVGALADLHLPCFLVEVEVTGPVIQQRAENDSN
jgi:hypothetical protein